tara:strand:+ start:105 stop:308 length:204 start_codon:yes stop_codon:yes gene_type:complete
MKTPQKVLYALCAVLLVFDIFIHKHGHFGWDDWFGFSAVYGIISCLVLVMGAKWLLPCLKKDEAYYD